VVAEASQAVELRPTTLTIGGVVPPGATSLVMVDENVVCVGVNAIKQVICASDKDWSTGTRLGREGEGPGELGASYHLGAGADGSVIVSDTGNNRLTWFDPIEGTWIKSHRVPSLFYQSGPERGGEVPGARMDLASPLTLIVAAINSDTGESRGEQRFNVPEGQSSEKVKLLVSRGWRLPSGEVGARISLGEIGYWTAEGEYLGTLA